MEILVNDTIGESPGNDVGQFNCPRGVVVAKGSTEEPLLYVSDYENHRVQVFNAVSGKFLRVIGKGSGPIITPRTAEVQQIKWLENFDLNLHIKKSLDTEELESNEPGHLQNPRGLAFSESCASNPMPTLYVADNKNNRVELFNADSGWHVMTIGKRGSEHGEFDRPTDVAVEMLTDVDGVTNTGIVLYVCDSDNHRIEVFNAITGNYIRSIGNGKGSNPGQLNYPQSIAIQDASGGSETKLYVVDHYSSKVHVFHAISGEFLHSFGEGSLKSPRGLAYAHIGDQKLIYVSCTTQKTIEVFDASTYKHIRKIQTGENSIVTSLFTAATTGKLVVIYCDQNDHKIHFID